MHNNQETFLYSRVSIEFLMMKKHDWGENATVQMNCEMKHADVCV